MNTKTFDGKTCGAPTLTTGGYTKWQPEDFKNSGRSCFTGVAAVMTWTTPTVGTIISLSYKL